MFNFKKFVSVSAVAILGVTNLLTPLTYAANVDDYDAASNPIRTGKSFSFIMPNHNVFLKAITEPNTYYVEYHGNTHTSGEMSRDDFTYDDTGYLTANAFAKTGYTFSGWNTEANGGGTGYVDGAAVFNWTAVDSGLINIYAQWKANGYNIIYDLNDDDGGTSSGVHSGEPDYLAYDQTGNIANPSRTGYGFSGWTITNMDSEDHIVGGNASNATSATGVTGTSFKNLRATSGDVNFKAIWSPDPHTPYTVDHYLQTLTGGYPDDPEETDELSGATDSKVTPARHTYTGFTAPAGQEINIDADGNTNLVYQYTRNHYGLTLVAGTGVSLVAGSGLVTARDSSSSSTTISFLYDEPVTVDFELKSGYTGGVWTGYKGTASSFNMEAASGTKIAYATPITYTITYNTRSGSVSPANPTTYTVESSGITLNNPSRIHSKFAGWTGGVIGGTQLAGPTMTVTIPTGSTGNRSYTATWTCLSGYHLNEAQTQCMPNSDTEYHVEHRFQTLTGGSDYDLIRTTTQTGETEQNTDAKTIDHVGFTVQTPIDNEPITGDGSTVIKIRYDRNSYTGTITEVTGITGATADGEYSHGPFKYEDTVELNADVESGYTFTHWTVKDASGDTVTVTNSGNIDGATFEMPASSVTITPNVSVNTYDITMILHNGTGTYPETYTVETPTFTLETPTRNDSGSVFDGWSGTDITTAPQKTVSITKGSVGDRTYEAIWSCRAGYHAEGDSCVANDYTVNIDLNYEDGTDTPLSTGFTYDKPGTIENPEQSGYDFAGWTISGLTSGATIDGVPVSGSTITGVMETEFENLTTVSGGTVTFTAQWTPKSNTKYVVHHYVKNVGESTYTHSGDVERTGTTNTDVIFTEVLKTFTGFKYTSGFVNIAGDPTSRPASGAVTSAKIAKDGSLEIYLYYDRNKRNVYLSGDAHIDTLSGAGQYEYGQQVSVSATVKTGYHFKEWRKKTDDTFNTDGNGN